MTDDCARMIEALVQKWLRESDVGRPVLRDSGMDIDKATDAVFELLNAGFVKIVTDGDPSDADGFAFNIEPRNPPEPPATVLRRPQKKGAS